MVPATRTAALKRAHPEVFAMTRHGMTYRIALPPIGTGIGKVRAVLSQHQTNARFRATHERKTAPGALERRSKVLRSRPSTVAPRPFQNAPSA